MTGFLLKNLYKNYNSQPDSQSDEEAEEKLANELRSQGLEFGLAIWMLSEIIHLIFGRNQLLRPNLDSQMPPH